MTNGWQWRTVAIGLLHAICLTSFLSFAESDDWGPEQDGLQTRLVALEDERVLGQPVRLRLEMRNTGTVPKDYDFIESHAIFFLDITGPQGRVPTIGNLPQVAEPLPRPIKPGEVVVLIDAVDITRNYPFGQPGRYRIRFLGYRHLQTASIPPSNVVEISIPSGAGSPSDVFVQRLGGITSSDCHLSIWRRTLDPQQEVTPRGRRSAKGLYAVLSGMKGPRGKADLVTIEVWKTSNRVPASNDASSQAGSVSKYLGKALDGYIYLWVPAEAETVCPTVRGKIAAVLGVRQE